MKIFLKLLLLLFLFYLFIIDHKVRVINNNGITYKKVFCSNCRVGKRRTEGIL